MFVFVPRNTRPVAERTPCDNPYGADVTVRYGHLWPTGTSSSQLLSCVRPVGQPTYPDESPYSVMARVRVNPESWHVAHQ